MHNQVSKNSANMRFSIEFSPILAWIKVILISPNLVHSNSSQVWVSCTKCWKSKWQKIVVNSSNLCRGKLSFFIVSSNVQIGHKPACTWWVTCMCLKLKFYEGHCLFVCSAASEFTCASAAYFELLKLSEHLVWFFGQLTISAKFQNPGIPGIRAVSQFLQCLFFGRPAILTFLGKNHQTTWLGHYQLW